MKKLRDITAFRSVKIWITTFEEGKMAKRFTDTEKWKIAWFRKLSPKHKCAWSFILDNCDHAGLWYEDIEIMSNFIGDEIVPGELEEFFKGKIYRIEDHKFFIKDFIDFQYGELNPNNKVHKSVLKKLEKIGVDIKGLTNSSLAPYEAPCIGAKDKDKDKDQDKVKEKEEEEEKEDLYPIPFENNLEPEVDFQKLSELFNKILAGEGKIKHAQLFCPPTFTVELKQTMAIPEFQKIDFWEKYFHKVKQSKYLKGLTKTNFTANLLWLIKLDNAYKALSGAYDNGDGEADMTEYHEMMKRIQAKFESEASA